MINRLWIALAALVPLVSCSAAAGDRERYRSPDAYTLISARHLVDGIEPRADETLIHVVVEIPTGTTAKWEVDKSDGALRWEFRDGSPRIVKYIGYPGNYGMVPRTLLPKELGGDGDPLDVLVLGPAVGRGDVVRARIIGVLKLLDGGEQDDKLVAVLEGTPMAGVQNMRQLDAEFRGVSRIIETWFSNYKGLGEMESLGFAGPEVAQRILATAIEAYAKSHSVER